MTGSEYSTDTQSYTEDNPLPAGRILLVERHLWKYNFYPETSARSVGRSNQGNMYVYIHGR